MKPHEPEGPRNIARTLLEETLRVYSAIVLVVNLRLVAIAVLACAACDAKKSSDVSTTTLAASNVAAALGIDADLPAPPDPSPASGDLKSDVAAFTTIDDCVAKQSVKIEPMIGDALLAFGYDTFLRDACRQIDAVKSRDSRKCDAIVASELARYCRATVAEVAGKSDDCPFASADASNGRSRTCVAIASRDPRLCTSSSLEESAQCASIVMHDETKCDVWKKSEIASCRRIGQRLASSLPPAQTNLPALPKMSATLSLRALAGTAPPAPDSSSLSSDAVDGVALTLGALDTSFSFGPSHEEAAFPHEVTPASPLRIGFEMHVSNAPTAEPKIRNVVLEIPGGVRLDDAQMHASPKIKIVKLDKERAGLVQFSIDGEVGSSPQAFAFHLEVTTFVRDLIRPN